MTLMKMSCILSSFLDLEAIMHSERLGMVLKALCFWRGDHSLHYITFEL
jgi:hypothetical protein